MVKFNEFYLPKKWKMIMGTKANCKEHSTIDINELKQ